MSIGERISVIRWALGLLVLVSNWLAGSVTLGQSTAVAGDPSRASPKIFLIGNSLTWDALPSLLAGNVQWHVDCGKNLQYIYDHPDKPCIPSSTLWPSALKQNRYDVLCVQPHFGTTLQQDVEVIDKWIRLQPQAVLVIHTGWARHADWEKEFHSQLKQGDDQAKMIHAPAYFAALKSRLAARHPNLEIRSTQVMQALDSIAHDIRQRRGPLGSLGELYRDTSHLTVQGGRYLAHNMMRRALGQPTSSQGFQLEPELQKYLDEKIRQTVH